MGFFEGISHFILIIKAILTRIIFATHGFVAIWRVVLIKKDPLYWYLTASILTLCFEGVFTLTIKENQEWKWFCPSVFIYLCSVVPAIWLIEVDKFDRKLALIEQAELNLTSPKVENAGQNIAAIGETFGVELKVPEGIPELDGETWVMVVEQLLMLILIIGRWLLPKGELTRDQLSQLLLVYIGTAADIIEFFDSFKDDKISSQRVLCLLILSIWSWSLLQFTFVLTATKSRRTRAIARDVEEAPKPKFVNGLNKAKEVCCSLDVWGILINIILQDAPFLIFRALLIFYYKIINYMNIFFTAKNTLVIILQFYRLYIVQQEKNKELSKAEAAAAKLAKVTVAKAPLAKAPLTGSSQSNPSVNKSKTSRSSKNSKKPQPKRAGKDRTKKQVYDSVTLDNKDAVVQMDAVKLDANVEMEDYGDSPPYGLNDSDLPESDLESGDFIGDLPPTNRKAEIKAISGSSESAGSRNFDRSSRRSTEYSSSSRDLPISEIGGPTLDQGYGSEHERGLRLANMPSQSYAQMGLPNGFLPADPDPEGTSERLFQRRAAIFVIFSLFLVIFILVMVLIYAGISPKGLVLRETFKVANSTKPRTNTTVSTISTTTINTLFSATQQEEPTQMPTAKSNTDTSLGQEPTSSAEGHLSNATVSHVLTNFTEFRSGETEVETEFNLDHNVTEVYTEIA